MDFDYFYKEQADQFTFYRVPKVLIIDDTFSDLSTDAKLLYGLLLDRVSLSANSGWFDEEGRVYVIYAIKSIMRDLHCGNKKAGNLLSELEQFGLIERKQRGQGKPWTIYVKNFSGVVSNGHLKTCQNDISRSVETTSQDMSKRHANNTNINNTEFNNTNPILSGTDVDNSDRESYTNVMSATDITVKVPDNRTLLIEVKQESYNRFSKWGQLGFDLISVFQFKPGMYFDSKPHAPRDYDSFIATVDIDRPGFKWGKLAYSNADIWLFYVKNPDGSYNFCEGYDYARMKNDRIVTYLRRMCQFAVNSVSA